MNGRQQPAQTGNHLVLKINMRGRYITENPEQEQLREIKEIFVFKQKHILATSQA